MLHPGRWAPVTIALLLLGAACGTETSDLLDPPADDVVVRVIVDGSIAADWTLAALENEVPFAEIEIAGDTESGPLLLDVLTASGVGTWETAEVIGVGEGRSFSVSLEVAAADVDAGWILDVTKRGTLKLASPDLPREQWVRDVAEIRIS